MYRRLKIKKLNYPKNTNVTVVVMMAVTLFAAFKVGRLSKKD
jgi:hypothetical protein